MSDKAPLRVVLCWHMHQPHYQDFTSGEYQLPWTYLHAIKDYVDMAAHLEAVPQARAVVNFAPILLEQIEDYARQVDGFLRGSTAIRDPLLAALDMPALPVDPEHSMWLVKACLRANQERMINVYPEYRSLAEMASWCGERRGGAMRYVAKQFLADLVVWYHLVWLGETVRRKDPQIKELMEKGNGFSLHDRRILLDVISRELNAVIGRYRALAEKGQVELSVTPYAHPIVPLLLDLHSARDAQPDVHLPVSEAYPGGEQRARWHIQRGLEVFERHFGLRPRGCWPSEGSVSEATLGLLEESGFAWVASGESVLRNSLERSPQAEAAGLQPHAHPYRVGDGRLACFFRDDGLSDLIGFTYADWHADDAVANLVHHLEGIADASDVDGRVVSIVLDGENAWEHYPQNGYFFLRTLYESLIGSPKLELTTFSDCLDAPVQVLHLPALVAGSWVYGTFSTWIGDEGKNRGWDMLVDAKHAFDKVVSAGELRGKAQELATHQLAICEGSDWFWWFGDYNPAETVSDFERLYRLHLANLYQMLGREPPEYLSQTFTHGRGSPRMGGVMRPGQAGA